MADTKLYVVSPSNDLEYTGLISQGATPGQINDMQYQVLSGAGYTGALPDMLWQFWAAGGMLTSAIAINGYQANQSDIVAFDDYAPASGPILISDQTAAGFDAPSSGDASIGFVYAGDIDASNSKRVPVKLLQDEIHIEGARRVTGYDVGLAIGSHVGPNDSAGNPTGTICAPGVAYFVTKSDVDPDARIPDITGLTVRQGATTQITNVDGTNFSRAFIDPLTAVTWNGLNGFEMVTTADSGAHRVFLTITGLSNPHRFAMEFVARAEAGGAQFIQIQNTGVSTQYANYDLVNGEVTVEGSGASGEIENLGDGYYKVRFRITADRPTAASTFAIASITGSTDAFNATHSTSGLTYHVLSTTFAANSGGSNVPYPGIINNTTGSTLARLDELHQPTVADTDYGDDFTVLFEALAEVGVNPSSAAYIYPAHNFMYGVNNDIRINAAGGLFNVFSGSISTVSPTAIAFRATVGGDVKASVDGGAVQTDSDADAFAKTAHTAIGVTQRNNSISNKWHGTLKRWAWLDSGLPDADLQAITTEPS